MARKTYQGLASGVSIGDSDTTNATALGATSTLRSNGTFATVTITGLTGWTVGFQGNSMGTSGTTLVYETITGTNQIACQIYLKYTGALTTNDATIMWIGAGSTRMASIVSTSAEQIRLVNSAGTTIFTSSFSGGLVQDTWYRIDWRLVNGGTTSTATVELAVFAGHGTSALTGTTYSGAANFSSGQTGNTITQVRFGPRSATGVASNSIVLAVPSYDRVTGTALLGPNSSTAYNGDAAIAISGTVTAAGHREKHGASTLTGTAAVTPTGHLDAHANSTLAIGSTISAAGHVEKHGAAALAVGATVSPSGHREAHGAAALALGAALTTSGIREKHGAAAFTGTATISPAGSVSHPSQGDVDLTATATLSAAGHVTKHGAAALTVGATISPAGTRGAHAAATISLAAGITPAGIVSTDAHGDTALAIGSSVTPAGHVTRHAAANISIGGTFTAGGHVVKHGSAALAFGVDLGSSGTRGKHATAALIIGAGLTATGSTVSTKHGAAAITVGVALAASGRVTNENFRDISLTTTPLAESWQLVPLEDRFALAALPSRFSTVSED